MRVCVVLNPSAGSAIEAETLRHSLPQIGAYTLRETTTPGDAVRLAAQALTEGFDLIVAAGGDGTINEVVNGLSQDWGRARLGVLPLGTGNDFARTLGISNNVQAAIDALERGITYALDVVCVESDATRYFVNVSAGGFSGLVDERLTDEVKAWWGPLAYLRTALFTLPDLTGYRMSIQFDEEEPVNLLAYNIVVANARYVAGGIPIAPQALVDDGLLDVLIVPAASLPSLAVFAPLILLGRHLDHPDLVFRRARTVFVESTPGIWFNTDGELVGNEPARFTILPRTLRVIVGPGFTAKQATE